MSDRNPRVAALLKFIDASPSPYHAIVNACEMLNSAGFTRVEESETWNCAPGGSYFTVRDGKALVAWRQGMESPVGRGYRIVAAHSDSPCLKLRPNAKLHPSDASWLKPDLYGSLLLHTWLDRDIRPTGVIFHSPTGLAVERQLVDLRELVFRACSLAPHLKRNKLDPSLLIDRERDMILLQSTELGAESDMLSILADASGIARDSIVGFDLFFADLQPSNLIGARQEFISAPRLDNLFSSWAALASLVELPREGATTRVAAIFDAEEIGSQTWAGARSTLLDAVLDRTLASYGDSAVELTYRARASSLIASLDMAHADHPSHAETIDPDNVPALNRGIAMKGGSRGNYAIAPEANARFAQACRRDGVPLQSFMYRCDHGGGSSVGPIASSGLGIPGFDLGAPLISMHSIREVAGAADVGHCTKALNTFYRM